MRDLFLPHFLTHKSGGQGTQGAPKQQTHRALCCSLLGTTMCNIHMVILKAERTPEFQFFLFPCTEVAEPGNQQPKLRTKQTPGLKEKQSHSQHHPLQSSLA